MKNIVKKSLVFAVFMLCLVVNANADVHPEITSEVCCANSTKKQCCESKGGIWCKQTDTCYVDDSLPSFIASPCVTEATCHDYSASAVLGRYRGNIWCAANSKCYGDIYDYAEECPCSTAHLLYCNASETCYTDVDQYVRTCADFNTQAKCEAARHEWCERKSICIPETAMSSIICELMK